MSAPERFQVGDTVRCVDHMGAALNLGQEFEVLMVDGNERISVDHGPNGWGWFAADRFVLVSRPTPPALDPFAWAERQAGWIGDTHPMESTAGAFVAWSRFCYWATSVNLAAHFLPTEAAARTRASNGRDVPPATVLVELPMNVVTWYAEAMVEPTRSNDYPGQVGKACRRALGGGA